MGVKEKCVRFSKNAEELDEEWHHELRRPLGRNVGEPDARNCQDFLSMLDHIISLCKMRQDESWYTRVRLIKINTEYAKFKTIYNDWFGTYARYTIEKNINYEFVRKWASRVASLCHSFISFFNVAIIPSPDEKEDAAGKFSSFLGNGGTMSARLSNLINDSKKTAYVL